MRSVVLLLSLLFAGGCGKAHYAPDAGSADGPGDLLADDGVADQMEREDGADLLEDLPRDAEGDGLLPGSIVLVAGQPGQAGGDDGPAMSATFNRPTGLARGPAGLYVVELGGEPQTRRVVLVRVERPSPACGVAPVLQDARPARRVASPSPWSLEVQTLLGRRQTLSAEGDTAAFVFGAGLGAGYHIALGDRWQLGGHLVLRYRAPDQDAGALSVLLGVGLLRRFGARWGVELRVLAGGTFYLGTEGDNDLLRGAAPVDVDGVLGGLTAAASLALLRHLAGSFWLRVPLEAQFSVVGAAAQLPATWVNRVLFGVGLRWG